jgi:hypothetical protein
LPILERRSIVEFFWLASEDEKFNPLSRSPNTFEFEAILN